MYRRGPVERPSTTLYDLQKNVERDARTQIILRQQICAGNLRRVSPDLTGDTRGGHSRRDDFYLKDAPSLRVVLAVWAHAGFRNHPGAGLSTRVPASEITRVPASEIQGAGFRNHQGAGFRNHQGAEFPRNQRPG